jgi:hypothetical protein
MRWVGHVASMGEKKAACRVLVVKREEKTRLEDLGLDWRIIFKYIFKKWNGSNGNY